IPGTAVPQRDRPQKHGGILRRGGRRDTCTGRQRQPRQRHIVYGPRLSYNGSAATAFGMRMGNSPATALPGTHPRPTPAAVGSKRSRCGGGLLVVVVVVVRYRGTESIL